MPQGYELYHQTRSSKIIAGQLGRYYHFRNADTLDFISFNVNEGKRPYKIVLGSLLQPNSKLRSVLDNLPERPFKKAALVHLLPQSIVENRQPIKAALDILEKEGYVKRLSTQSSSEEYIRTDKPSPPLKTASTLIMENTGGDKKI